MPARLQAAAGEAGGFNAVQKLLTNPASRHGVKARVSCDPLISPLSTGA